MKTKNSPTKFAGKMATRLRIASWSLAVAALGCLGAPNANAIIETWTGGAMDNNFSTAGNYSANTAPTGNTILFGTNAATVPNPTTFTSISILQLGFQGAGWKIGTTSGAGQTLTLSGNPLALPGIGTGLYVLASTGTGTNEIAPNVAMTGTNGAPVFVDTGSILKLDGTLSTASAFTLTGTGTLTVGGAFTSTGIFTSNTGATLSAAGYTDTSAMNLGTFVSPGTTGTVTSTFNVTGGTFSSGALNIGTGALNIGSTVTTFASGAITLYSGGTLSLANSTANDIGTAVTSTVYSGGKLVFDNSVNNVARVNTPTATNAITLNGGELGLVGNTGATTAQSAYLVFNGTAADTITLTPSAGQLTSLTNANATNNLVTANAVGGTVLIRGTNLGQAAGQTAGESQFFLTTTPTAAQMPGGLVPFAIGDTSTTGQGSTFLSYNATTGFTPVTSTATTIAAAGTGVNVLQTSSDATQTASQTINSLLVSGSGLTTTLTGTLTLTSGVYLATSGATGDTLTGGTLSSSSGARLYVYVEDGAAATDLTVGSSLNTANNLTKSGAGTLLLNTAVTGTGSIDVAQGTLMLGAANVLGASGNLGNTIYVGSGATFDLNGNSLNIVTANTLGKANNQNNQAGQITNSSGTQSTLTFTASNTTAERYTGNLAITVNSGTLFFQNATTPNTTGLINTYTGNTTVNGGVLEANDGQLGAFSNTLFLAGGTLEVANNTAFSASRNIVLNGTTGSAIQQDANSAGLTSTFNGGITAGTGTTLTLQSGVGGSTAGAASVIAFAGTAANQISSTINLTLNTANAALNTPLTVNFAGSQTLGSLATGAGTFAANTNIGVVGTLSVGGSNTSTAYSGAIRDGTGGTAAFAKTGTGTLSLSGATSFTGGTTISGGQVTLTGSSAASSSQTLTTTASNVINTTNTTGLAFGQPVSGTGIPAGAYITSVTSGTSFTINANATVQASTMLTFGAYSGLGTGAVTVSGGTLSLGSATALTNNTSALTVSGGALTSTVAGTTLGGNLAMTSGSISPNGASVGMLTLSAGKTFTMSAGTLFLTLTSGGNDQIVGTSTSTFSLTGGTLDLGGVTAAAGTSYQVFNTFAGTGNTVSGINYTDFAAGDGSTPTLSNTGVLSFAAVPEPSTWVAGVGLFLLLAGRYWRNRRTA